MRYIWLIAKREYLERVRTRSFLISTLLLPACMAVLIVIPQKLATIKAGGERHIAVVTSRPDLAEAVDRELTASNLGRSRNPNRQQFSMAKYRVDVDVNTTEAERSVLRDKVSAGTLDGYLWLTDEAVSTRKVTFYSRETSDYIETANLTNAVTQAVAKQELTSRGIPEAEITRLFEPTTLDLVAIKAGTETKSKSGTLAIMSSFVMVMLLYMTIFLYAIAVMRAVLEEKNSRVMEVMLSSVRTGELMAGKILGVGAVGLTQILIWAVMIAPVALSMMSGIRLPEGTNISGVTLASFAIFYLLGYVLYSSMFATLGAICNSEQEAQQWQMFIVSPMIIAIMLMMSIQRQPNSALAFWTSLVPFFSPILMYMRVLVETPPFWQIALSIALLIGTIGGMVILCGRIYRVGVLMYGKRPTLPEILKWVRYE